MQRVGHHGVRDAHEGQRRVLRVEQLQVEGMHAARLARHQLARTSVSTSVAVLVVGAHQHQKLTQQKRAERGQNRRCRPSWSSGDGSATSSA